VTQGESDSFTTARVPFSSSQKNWVEKQIRPWALGRSNWLFAGSLRSGQRAVEVMTLIQSAKFNPHDPYADLKDVLTKLPTQKNSAIGELLRHNWTSAIDSKV
jgi:transposase